MERRALRNAASSDKTLSRERGPEFLLASFQAQGIFGILALGRGEGFLGGEIFLQSLIARLRRFGEELFDFFDSAAGGG